MLYTTWESANQISHAASSIKSTATFPLTPIWTSGFLDYLTFYYTTNYTFNFSLKIIACLLFLILIRGGVPRYRYDFLTKIGWVKFLGYVLSVFVLSLFLLLVWQLGM